MTRVIYEITGADAESFLQGLVTNDMSKMGEGLLYAALLTPQGKYMADFFLSRRGEAILLDVDETLSDTVFKRLSMYKLRSQVEIVQSPLKVRCGTGPAPEGALADPRHPDMGWRLYGDESGTDGTDFESLRVAHCIPQSGVELTPDTFILEAGFERLNGVDFRKGCYVGQEVTARMKHKTELRKGLVTVGLTGTAPVGTAIEAEGKQAGTLLTQAGGQAIAYMRFDRAKAPLRAGEATITFKE